MTYILAAAPPPVIKQRAVTPTATVRTFNANALSAEQRIKLTPLMTQVQKGLNDLVATSRNETRIIANKFKNSPFTLIRAIFSFTSKEEADAMADEWAASIVKYAEQVRGNLVGVDATGLPYFVRRPDDADRILNVAKNDLNDMIADFGDEVERNSFKAFVTDIIDTLLSLLFAIAEIVAVAIGRAAAKFPLGFGIVAALAGGFIYFKYIRKS